MKWYRNKDMLLETIEDNKKAMKKTTSDKTIWLLQDYNNLIQDHLELLAEVKDLRDEVKDLRDECKNRGGR